jgi:hypothetical protein
MCDFPGIFQQNLRLMTTYIFSDVSYGETKFQPVTIEQAQKVKK